MRSNYFNYYLYNIILYYIIKIYNIINTVIYKKNICLNILNLIKVHEFIFNKINKHF